MLVSITIPVYNNLEGLKNSLQTVVEQTYPNWEAIVVDDGSLENHKSIVDAINDNRIRFFRFEKNQGRAIARQKTLEMIQGEYCAFLDAGDFYEKNFLENAVNILLKNKHLIGVTQTMKIVYQGKVYYSSFDEDKCIDIKSNDYQEVPFASTIIKAFFLNQISLDISLKHSEDRYLLNHIASNNHGKIMLLNTNSYVYNQDEQNAKLSTTLRKYSYESLRLLKDKKYTKTVLNIFKTLFIVLFHSVFGYQKLLEFRYKK
ncbi:glycosyltransferase family A protein [Capnocytophaga sp.]|uniref:glycosyltransferase family 2 protein n=1 Tax=Capnocytophaga sp. TaxID=44737 RepID=UPI0026DC1D6F|nr:glycosyltransferase family A protein [Capnocytophaga sp.]MDO5104873.1 glycosyltransferase family A protein [Capnocytophaga sp.]